MNKILESLYRDIELNRERTANTKSILIKEYVSRDLTNCDEFMPFFNDDNYNCLGDICNMSFDDVRKFYNEYYKDKNSCIRNLYNLKNTMHLNGLIFKDEYKNLDMDDDFLCILLNNIEMFPSRAYRALYRNNIYTLGDLLSLEYNDLAGEVYYPSKIKGLGQKNAKKVIEYVHNIGFLLKNEENSKDYIISKYRNSGILVIEDIIDDTSLCNVLYSNKIYSVDNLKEIGFDVLEIAGIGKKSQEYLKKLLFELDDNFNIEYEFNKICSSIELLLTQLDELVSLEKSQILKKEMIIEEYCNLLNEMENNRKRNEELDKEILNMNDINKIMIKR